MSAVPNELPMRSLAGRVSSSAVASRTVAIGAAAVTTQKTARQPKVAIMRLPVSGARIGDIAEHQHQQRHQPRGFGAGVQVAHDGARHHHARASAEPLDEAEADQPFDVGASAEPTPPIANSASPR